NSSSPQTSTRGTDCLTAERGILLFGLAAVLVDAVKHFTHVLDLFEEGMGDEDRAFLGSGEGEAITGAGIDFDDFAGELVLLLQDQAGEIGGVFQFGDHDPLDGDVETLEDALDEVMSERPFFWRVAQK